MRLICLSWGEPSPGLGRLLAKEREFNKLQESGDKTIFTKVRCMFLGHAANLVCRRKPAPLTFPLPGGKGVRSSDSIRQKTWVKLVESLISFPQVF